MTIARAPKVSVVIPTFNRADFIGPAIDSVLQQSLTDVEIIVVDDGSSDDTPRRLERYAGRLTCLRTPNQGPARARNVGMQAAAGDYIAYLDSDDLYLPFKLELQAAWLDSRPDVGLVYTEFSGFDDAGFEDEWHLRTYHRSAYRGVSYDDLFTERTPLSETPLAPVLVRAGREGWLDRCAYVGDIFDQYLLKTLVFTNSVLFRRSLLASTGLQARRFGLFHDHEFVLRLCRLAPASFLDVPTYRLRYHPGQISTTASPRGQLVAIRKQRDLLRVLKAFCRENPAYYAAHQPALDRQLARRHRAIALPMLAWDPRDDHQRRMAQARARRHLEKAAALGYPDRVAWAASFVPRAIRRLPRDTLRALRGRLPRVERRAAEPPDDRG